MVLLVFISSVMMQRRAAYSAIKFSLRDNAYHLLLRALN